MIRLVPSAEPPPAASRQRPDCGLRRVPSPGADQTCAALPLQVYSSTLVLLAVAPPVTSRHLPSERKVSPLRVQLWLLPPLQVHKVTVVPSPALTSTHLLPMPVMVEVAVPVPVVAPFSLISREPCAGTEEAVQLPVAVPRSVRETRSRTDAVPLRPSPVKGTLMFAALDPRLNTPTTVLPSASCFFQTWRLPAVTKVGMRPDWSTAMTSGLVRMDTALLSTNQTSPPT